MNGWGLLVIGFLIFLLGCLGTPQGDKDAGGFVMGVGGVTMLVGITWAIIVLLTEGIP